MGHGSVGDVVARQRGRRFVRLALTLTACLGLAVLWATSWFAILSALPVWAIILIVLVIVVVAASNP